MQFESLLRFGIDQGATDIHLQAGGLPQLRIGGLMRGLEGAAVPADELGAFLRRIAPPPVAEAFDPALRDGTSFSAAIEGLSRFRCTLYSQLGAPAAVLRPVPAAVPTLEALHLPPVLREIALARRGLALVVGPRQSGRTTTLAAMVGQVNAEQRRKVVTIEAPVEFRHEPQKALVAALEVGLDTPTFAHGIARAVQQDADAIVVGDLPDAATARAALRAADSGCQVVLAATGSGAIGAIEDLLRLFPADERVAATRQLAHALEAIVALRLAQARDGRRPVVEVLRGGPYPARALLAGRLDDLARYLTGRQGGMQTLDQHLLDLHGQGLISGTEALRLATDPEALATEFRSRRPVPVG